MTKPDQVLDERDTGSKKLDGDVRTLLAADHKALAKLRRDLNDLSARLYNYLYALPAPVSDNPNVRLAVVSEGEDVPEAGFEKPRPDAGPNTVVDKG